MGDHGGPRARGAAALCPGFGGGAAGQRACHPAGVGGDHAAGARRGAASGRCAAALRAMAGRMAAAVSGMVRGAARRALAAARTAALGDPAGAGRRRLAAAAARLSMARARRRTHVAGSDAAGGGARARRSLGDDLRRRPGAGRAGAHGAARAAIRRRPGVRRDRQRRAHRGPGAARARRGATRRARPLDEDSDHIGGARSVLENVEVGNAPLAARAHRLALAGTRRDAARAKARPGHGTACASRS